MGWGQILLALAGLAMASVGVWLLLFWRQKRAVLVLGLFLLFRGLLNAVQGTRNALVAWGAQPPIPVLQGPIVVDKVLWSPVLFLLILFVVSYPRRRGWLGKSRWGPRLLIGLAAVQMVLLVVDPLVAAYRGPLSYWGLDASAGPDSAFYTQSVRPFLRWFILGTSMMTIPAYAMAGLVFVLDYVHEDPIREGSGLLLVAVGLSFDAIRIGAANVFYMVRGDQLAGSLNAAETIPHISALLPAIFAVGLLTVYAHRSLDPRRQRAAAWGVAGLLLPVAVEIGRRLFGPDPIIYGLAAATSVAAMPALVAYGVMHHRLFGIDLAIKRGIRRGTVAAAFLVAFLVATQTVQLISSGIAALTAGVVAMGVLLLGLTQVRRFGDRVAEAAMPAVRDEPVYLDHRKLEVYQAALRDAVDQDGRIRSDEVGTLKRLREALGLTDRDHELLLRIQGMIPEDHGRREDEVAEGRTVLERYRIEQRLGEGGQSTAWLATDLRSGAHVVLKVLPAGGSKGSVMEREVRALARLDHPNLVRLHAVETLGEDVVLVMDYAQAGTLQDQLDRGPLDGPTAARLAEDLLSSLGALHEEGIVHRDVKPNNLLVADDGRYLLSDLGIAKVPGVTMTTIAPGALMEPWGTIPYMSPEQARGQEVDRRSDLYSAAATLYGALAGRPLIEEGADESAIELRIRVASWQGFEAHDGLPPGLVDWFTTALARDPGDRFPDAKSMLEAFLEATGSS